MESVPIINLPEDEELVTRLRLKLEEYRNRYDDMKHPGLQIGNICKIAIVERLLDNGNVNTWDLSLELSEKYGESFDTDKFNNACGVIEDYCTNFGANVSGGTGLPLAK